MTMNGSFPDATASGSGVSGGLWGEVFLAGEETQEGPALLRVVVTDGSASSVTSLPTCARGGR